MRPLEDDRAGVAARIIDLGDPTANPRYKFWAGGPEAKILQDAMDSIGCHAVAVWSAENTLRPLYEACSRCSVNVPPTGHWWSLDRMLQRQTAAIADHIESTGAPIERTIRRLAETPSGAGGLLLGPEHPATVAYATAHARAEPAGPATYGAELDSETALMAELAYAHREWIERGTTVTPAHREWFATRTAERAQTMRTLRRRLWLRRPWLMLRIWWAERRHAAEAGTAKAAGTARPAPAGAGHAPLH